MFFFRMKPPPFGWRANGAAIANGYFVLSRINNEDGLRIRRNQRAMNYRQDVAVI
jgi:hypothetical protein